MPFIEVVGENIFTTEAQAIAVAVNCRGVAGAGLAYEARKRYPAWFEEYRQQCRSMRIYPNLPMTLFRESEPWLINFPTKVEWQEPSTYEYLMAGILQLEQLVKQEGLTSVALPKLGCGLGGLPWRSRKGIQGIRELLTEPGNLKRLDCTFYLYE